MNTLYDFLIKNCESKTSQLAPSIQFLTDKLIGIPILINKFNDKYIWSVFVYTVNNYNYGDLVDTFIKLIYSDKEMFAIINNYLLDPTDEAIKVEFDNMQAVRKEAKYLAKEILTNFPYPIQ